MKIAIIILAADGPYTPLINAIRETWGAEKYPDIDIYYNYCWRTQPVGIIDTKTGQGYIKNEIINDIPKPEKETILWEDQIICPYKDGKYSIHAKTVDAFEWIAKNRKYDYVFRCCCGSYIRQHKLYEFLQEKATQRFYCGASGTSSFGRYISGSGFILSWDLVELIGFNKSSIEKVDNIYDDINIGNFLTKKGVPLSEGPRYMFDHDLTPESAKAAITQNNYHYHLHHNYRNDNFFILHEALKETNDSEQWCIKSIHDNEILENKNGPILFNSKAEAERFIENRCAWKVEKSVKIKHRNSYR